MLRLNARNPIFLTAVSAIIVVSVFAALSPRFVPRTITTASQSEAVMIAQPKLEVRAPAATPAATAAAENSLAQPEIARTGSIEVLVGNVDASIGRIAQTARNERGDVFSLDAQNQTASMTVRIPASRFDTMMNQLAALGTVQSRSVRAEDLSSNITDSSARLRNLKRTEADILKIMDRSGRVSEIMDVENQLSSVREQIETLEADVASMRGRVAYSTIDIKVDAEAKSAPVEPGALAQLKNVVAASTHSLVDTTIALIAVCIWLVVYVPYILAAALALWFIRHRYIRAGRS